MLKESFVGQKRVKHALRESILRGSVSHAYIFEGPEGIGKKTMAELFATAIHCESGTGEPCGKCHACMMHQAMSHPDYQVFEEQKKASVGVEHIRQLIEDAYLRPMIADKKVYIIPHADDLTLQAQNALLKVFEEPPGDSIIILVSENSERLLATIRSRARRVVFERHEEAEIRDFLLERYPHRAEEIPFISRFSDGRIGQAKSLIEDESFMEDRREFLNRVAALGDKESNIYGIRDFLNEHKDEGMRYLDLMLSFLRDALRVKLEIGNLLNEDFTDIITEFSEKSTAKGLSRAADAVIYTGSNMNKNSNRELWFLEMLTNCWRELHGSSYRRTVS